MSAEIPIYSILIGNCFRQQRVDYRLDYSTADELKDANSKDDCERQCINSFNFQCRGFAYRYTHPSHNVMKDSYQSSITLCEAIPLKFSVITQWEFWSRLSSAGRFAGRLVAADLPKMPTDSADSADSADFKGKIQLHIYYAISSFQIQKFCKKAIYWTY